MKSYYKYLIMICLYTSATYATSVDTLKRACEVEHNLEQCYQLGLAYSKGDGVRQNSTYAKKYFSLACSHGLEIACTALKGEGESIKEDDACEKAFTYYTELVTSFKKGDREQALKKYRQACAKRIQHKKNVSPQPDKAQKILDTAGVDGIVDIDPSNVEENIKYIENLRDRTRKVDKENSLTQEQVNKSCSSKAFISLLDSAEAQTQAGHYKKALEIYRKAYVICPMKDIEGQMAWLLGEVSNINKERK